MGKVFDAFARIDRTDETDDVAPGDGLITEEAEQFGLTEPFDFNGHRTDGAAAPRLLEKKSRRNGSMLLPTHTLIRPGREVELELSRTDPHLVTLYDADPRSSEQYERLAVTLVTAALERPLKRVLIVSAQQGEGRTSVTLNLAVELARAKQRVLVVESDLYRPAMSRLLGLETELGLAEVIRDGMPVGNALIRVRKYDFDLLPVLCPVEHTAELLTATGLYEQLQTLDEQYDFMLFDSPPLLQTADAGMLVRLTDTSLLVVRPGQTSAAQMAEALAPLDRENLLGVVFNRVAQA